ncbi:MAG: glutaredoxin family protein [Polaromonas sp.]
MRSNTLHFLAPKALLALAVIAGSLASPLLQAQQVYRIVGPDGKVTFSDRPPPVSASNTKTSEANLARAGSAVPASLPYELRQVALKYPVVLYTAENCAPCGAGRSMLTSRGIPFSEKTVTTAGDTEALQRLSGETSLPFLTIGSQHLKGFSDAEWTQFLDAAAYPKSSRLPASYRAPAPAPLVAVAVAPAAAPASAAAAGRNASPAALPVQPAPTSTNPAGIRF